MTGARGLVSVVIAARDAERYLADAIDSVLAQTYPQVEPIVVDDGSQDRTTEIARGYGPRLRCVRQPGAGPGAARNRGVELATGEFLAFLDADDLFPPERLARQIQELGRDPTLDAVFGHVAEFGTQDGNGGSTHGHRAMLPPLASHFATAMVTRRVAFDRVGPFSTDLTVGKTIDWYARAVDTGLRMSMLQEVVLHRRLHARNLGIVEAGSTSDYLRVVKATLDRRRGRAES